MQPLGFPEAHRSPILRAWYRCPARFPPNASLATVCPVTSEPGRALPFGTPHPDDPAPLPDLDDSALARLLGMAGPDHARELLHSLDTDLRTAADGIAAAIDPGDWPVLRQHAHVLVALSGAIGAVRVQADADLLGQIARMQDRAALRQIGPGMLARLDALIDRIGRRLADCP